MQYANKRLLHGRRQFVVSNAHIYFRRWNYNCAFYYYYLTVENIYKTNKTNILHS
jgi:hypothetical protein